MFMGYKSKSKSHVNIVGLCKDVGKVCMYVVVYVCMCKDIYEGMHVSKVVGKACVYVDVYVCLYVSTYACMN